MQQSANGDSALLSAVLDASLDAVVVMDEGGRVVEWNKAAARIFGYTAEEAVGEIMGELIVPPDLRDAHRKGLERYLETGEPRVLGKRIELTAIDREGREFPVEIAITRVDLDGPALFAGTMRDVTSNQRWVESMRTMAKATRVLGSSLDYEATLQEVADLFVPGLADWCTVDLLDGMRFESVAVAHADPAKVEIVRAFRDATVLTLNDEIPLAAAVRTNQPVLLPEIPDELIDSAAPTPEDAARLRQLGFRSSLIVPLRTRERILGAIALANSESRRRFDSTDADLMTEVAERAAAAIENARLYQERSYIAETLQRSLLPPTLTRIPGLDVAAAYHSAQRGIDVGGDFYDLFRFDEPSWAAVVGDVQGKGVHAASLVSLARHTLRAAALTATDPESVVRLLNATLRQHQTERLLTAAFALIEPTATGARIVVVAAGHPPPIVRRADGSCLATTARGTLLGVFADVRLDRHEFELEPGDALLMYSDGVAGRLQTPAEVVVDRLQLIAPGADAAALAATAAGRPDWGESPPADDVTVLALRVTGESGDDQ